MGGYETSMMTLCEEEGKIMELAASKSLKKAKNDQDSLILQLIKY
jgi:hypothetical protein